MIWLNPWAWIGLVAVGVPIALHLLTRAQPRPQPFPTLRFLGRATTTAVRRRVLRDRALLAVRVATLAAVVAAGARPYFRTPARLAAGASALIRAVVIDTSDRFGRISTDGRPAIDVARERAARLEPPAATSVSIEVDRLPEGLARATTWLHSRGGREEIVVLSAFQRGALAQSDVSGVPADIGVRLVKIDTTPRLRGVGPGERVGNRLGCRTSRSSQIARSSRGARLRFRPDPAMTSGSWPVRPKGRGLPRPWPPPGPSAHRLYLNLDGIRSPSFSRARRVGLASSPQPPRFDQRWMFSVVERLRHDAALAAASADTAADQWSRPGLRRWRSSRGTGAVRRFSKPGASRVHGRFRSSPSNRSSSSPRRALRRQFVRQCAHRIRPAHRRRGRQRTRTRHAHT